MKFDMMGYVPALFPSKPGFWNTVQDNHDCWLSNTYLTFKLTLIIWLDIQFCLNHWKKKRFHVLLASCCFFLLEVLTLSIKIYLGRRSELSHIEFWIRGDF